MNSKKIIAESLEKLLIKKNLGKRKIARTLTNNNSPPLELTHINYRELFVNDI